MDELTMTPEEILELINLSLRWLTTQQYKTLKGQVLSGVPDAALRGLRRILMRQCKAAVIIPDRR